MIIGFNAIEPKIVKDKLSGTKVRLTFYPSILTYRDRSMDIKLTVGSSR